jgi:hypothetical protein
LKLDILKGTTNKSVDVFIADSSVTTGAGKTGLVFNTSGLKCYYHRAGAVPVVHTLATQTVTGAWSSGGFVELDATNMPGMYRLDLLNAVLASGVDEATVMITGTGIVPCPLELQLVSYNPNDAQRLGLTALPAADSGATGGIITQGTGTAQLNVVAGRASANVTQWAGTTTALIGSLPSVDATTISAAAYNAVRDAILNAVVDDSSVASASALTTQVTLKQSLSLCTAFAAGRSSNSGQTFSTIDNAKVRITGTAVANNRTVISATPSG